MLTTPRTTGPLISAATIPSSSHWGAFGARVEGGRMVEAVPHPADPDPSPLLGGVAGAVHHRSRVARPAVRRGWLEARASGDATLGRERRGSDEFVEVEWDEALDLVADELRRVRDAARQRGDLRRLLRLGQRRPLPPRAEPAAPLPQPRRRLHVLGQHLQHRLRRSVLLPHVVGDAARCAAPGVDVADDRRAHRARGRLRRHPGQERVRRAGRGDPPPHPTPPRGRGRRRGRGSRSSARCAATSPTGCRPTGTRSRPGTDVALMLGAGAHAARRGPRRPRSSSSATPSAPTCSPPTCSARPTGSSRTPSGRPRSPASRPTRSGRWPGGWRPAARWSR